MPSPNSTDLLKVHVRNRSRTLFEGDAVSVTSLNNTGVFDVLAQHANFITLINKYITIKKPDLKIETIEIEKGVLRVIENKVDIYLEINPT
ncbi:hypothetical protein KC571_00940 [candidate division WWE3 bacterium]|uniref:ATP synthase F1 complex delta/epsilon subunit N-terminal domain-containing protein n=1 Tax=candidate division WWE3 bacterium TaxID=2053526 RepID=A0A955LGE7_UNCKA|nr:hypothetical protein [candidate division WWE3 bacterium]